MAKQALVRMEPNQALDQTRSQYTVSQLIGYFAAGLPATSNYPRHARQYVDYCLKEAYTIDALSFGLYAAGLPPNRVSPLRRFLFFYQSVGSPRVIADPKTNRVPPAVNELVLRFIRDAKNLRGERSKETYTKALNAFFVHVDGQLQAGQPASLNGVTVSDYVQHLKTENYSAFTINLYLSAIKQLAAWCIRQRESLQLDEAQRESLRDIAQVRGLVIERTFYKDSLDKTERAQLMDQSLPARDRAILSLLGLEGLRTIEVTRLRLGDVDVSRQQLHVLGKGKHTKKAIKLFGMCLAHLQTYLLENERWPILPAHRHEFLFSGLQTHHIRYLVSKHLRRVGLKRVGVSAHSLRHTVGQLLLADGVSLEHVQQHLRHETMETTQFYTKKQTQRTYLEQMPD